MVHSVKGFQPKVSPGCLEKAAGAHIRLESIVLKLARADRVFISIKHNNIITHNISEKSFFLVREAVLQ